MHTASLVSITPDAEKTIVFCARVSNPKNQDQLDTAPKLLRYLVKHRHWSPFELAHMTVEILTTRSVSAQLLRHRSAAFQEFSQRYADVAVLPELVMPDLRIQDKKAKQKSYGQLEDASLFKARIQEVQDSSLQVYADLLNAGAARETARDVLPMGTTSRLYMSASVRTWIHYFMARCHLDTQKEHRQIASEIRDIFRRELPVISSAMDQLMAEDANKEELLKLYAQGKLQLKGGDTHGFDDGYGESRVLVF